ncbi:gastrin/cholecystokinin type B receptor-like [Babylonia areolata]|uniref:gastrin/cholecystokinin type B receptor-like n=1 Tax=Babylonia areolata TaxID=304850 RepID=UPI003FD1A987
MAMSVFFRGQRKRHYNPTQLLVLTLALNDLAVCLLLLPFDLYRLRHFYSLTDEVLCDVFEYIRNVTMCLSCLLLTCTAVERYRAVCSAVSPRPQGRKGAVLLVLCLLLFSLLLASPTPRFLGIQHRPVPPLLIAHFSAQVQEAHSQFSGRTWMFSCEYLDAYDHTWGLRLFGLSSLLLFLVVVVVSIGAYGKIYHKDPFLSQCDC